MNKLALIFSFVFAILNARVMWSDSYSLSFKFLYLFLCGSLTFLLMVFESKLEDMNKERMKEVEKND